VTVYCTRRVALFVLYSLGGDVLALCHDKQASDIHQARPFNSPNGQGLTHNTTTYRIRIVCKPSMSRSLSHVSVKEVEPELLELGLRGNEMSWKKLRFLNRQPIYRGGSTGGRGPRPPNEKCGPSGPSFWPSLPRLSLK